jgi:hypothetical protein
MNFHHLLECIGECCGRVEWHKLHGLYIITGGIVVLEWEGVKHLEVDPHAIKYLCLGDIDKNIVIGRKMWIFGEACGVIMVGEGTIWRGTVVNEIV